MRRLLIAIIWILLAAPCLSDTLYESYETGKDNEYAPYAAIRRAQTFTPSTNHTITSVFLYICKYGTPPTSYTLAIYATTDGKPSGSALCSATFNPSGFTTYSTYDWQEVTISGGSLLSASTMYAIVVYATAADGDSSNKVQWGEDASTPAYAGGTVVTSTDSGASWNLGTGIDQLFQEWGNPEAAADTHRPVVIARRRH